MGGVAIIRRVEEMILPPADVAAILALIERQFDALAWEEGSEVNWPAFFAGFVSEAQLFAAARPIDPQPVAAFAERMRRLARNGTLSSFSERPLGIRIAGYGSVAVALAGCEIRENGNTIARDVSAFLLLRSERGWCIAAQGWDAETGDNPFPPELMVSKAAPVTM